MSLAKPKKVLTSWKIILVHVKAGLHYGNYSSKLMLFEAQKIFSIFLKSPILICFYIGNVKCNVAPYLLQ